MYVIVRRFDVEIESYEAGYSSSQEFLDDLGIPIQTLDSLREWPDNGQMRDYDMWTMYVSELGPFGMDDYRVKDQTVEEFKAIYFTYRLDEEPKGFEVSLVDMKRLFGGTVVMSEEVLGNDDGEHS